MMYIIENKTDRKLNLGKCGGHMLVFEPHERKELSESELSAHNSVIEKYVDGDFLDVITKAKKEVVVDAPVVETKTKTVTKKKVTKE